MIVPAATSAGKVAIKDKELLKKFEVIQELNGDTKKLVDNFLDMIIRDHAAKKAHSPSK